MKKELLVLLIGAFIYTCSWSQSAGDTAKQNLQTVLFATNEDCDLEIYGAFLGSISKREHKELKLAPGNYTYKAVSKTGVEELEESFAVKESGLNEIFIDLLYVYDQNQKKAEATKVNELEKPVSDDGNVVDTVQQETRLKANEPAAVMDLLLRNMVSVSGGSFVMGNNKAPAPDEAEHTVTINSILFSKYEVTQEQWQVIMGDNPSGNKGCATCPVENVSWEDAMIFIKKLNDLSNKRFRLPTEAEWEYVAKFGGKMEVDKEGGQEEYIKATAWYFANSDKKTHPVGQKKPNALGVYDMLGNVSEWCFDWYSADHFKNEGSVKNPVGPPLGKEKLVRGGSYIEYQGDRFRPSLRQKFKPTTKSSDLGFRLVREMN